MSREHEYEGVDRATLTLPELAAVLGLARSTTYDLAKRDALPVPIIRLGRRRVVSRELVDRVLAGEQIRRNQEQGG